MEGINNAGLDYKNGAAQDELNMTPHTINQPLTEDGDRFLYGRIVDEVNSFLITPLHRNTISLLLL